MAHADEVLNSFSIRRSRSLLNFHDVLRRRAYLIEIVVGFL